MLRVKGHDGSRCYLEIADVSTPSGCELIRTAVQFVLKDDEFCIPSESARRARSLAEKYLKWCKEERVFQSFSDELVTSLQVCFMSKPTVKACQKRMWESYFKYRLCSKFVQKWNDHLSPISGTEPSSPIFYQFVTDAIMEEMIKIHFPVTTEQRECSATLDYEEHNDIRYTAGYVLKTLLRKINHSSHPLKEELALCIEELKEEGSAFSHASEEWLKAIDRGGLVHVNDMTYMLFTAMEQALRPCLVTMEKSTALDGSV